MKIDAHLIDDAASTMLIRPGGKQRGWMDDTPNKYAYRCLPLTIANCTGWDLYAPCDFVVSWNGGSHESDMSINYELDDMHFAGTGFGCGILTLHSGYVLKTSEGWDIMCTAPINTPIEWATPLTGIVETWWLNFTFTINWKLHKAGSYHHDSRIPVARIIPIPHQYDIETSVSDIVLNPKIDGEYQVWREDRGILLDDMNEAFTTNTKSGNVDPGKPKTHWEKTYYTGKTKHGEMIEDHTIKRDFPEFT